jgi:hypothetical protein
VDRQDLWVSRSASGWWVVGRGCGGLGDFAETRSGTVVCVEFAFVAFNLAEYGVWVTVLVYAYGHGGTTATAFVAVAQLVPADVLAPTLTALLLTAMPSPLHLACRGRDRARLACLRRGCVCEQAELYCPACGLGTGAAIELHSD